MIGLVAFVAAIAFDAAAGTAGLQWPDGDVFWALRAPRVALAVLAGLGLSSGGVACQALMKNPLADPYVLGLSGGAALGAVFASIFFSSGLLGVPPPVVLMLASLGGAWAASYLVMTAQGPRTLTVGPLLLTGVVFNTFAAAVITLVKTVVSAQKAQEILFWLMGELDVYDFRYIVAITPLLAIGFGLLLFDARKLDLLVQGDRVAETLGVATRPLRRRVYAALTLSIGAVVALTGLIGFIGLVVPHLVRSRLGSEHRPLLLHSALWGGALLCLADACCRLGFAWFSTELPVGAITAFFGAPYFLWVLRRRHFDAALG